MKKHTITPEKIIALAIFLFIALFFLAEMLMKPISGEDVAQANCMAFTGWHGANECAESTLNSIPRIGQVAHYLVIWKFHSLPTLGFETIIRLIDALMCFAIIYMITTLALGGKRPQLKYKDATIAASTFILLILSPFTEMFFKGFSNVHNYVPAVLFTLLFIFFWFHHQKIQKRLNKTPFNILFVLIAFVFAASTELNSLIFFALLVGHLITKFITTKKLNTLFKNWQNYLSGIIGTLLGFAFIYILGNGLGATVGRSSGSYLSSLNITDIFTDPLTAIPQFLANFINNFYQYLPFLLLAIAGTALLKHLSKPKSNREDQNTLLSFRTIIIYVILYIALCSPINGVLWRLSAVAFCTLLVPITRLLSQIIHLCKTKLPLAQIIAISSLILVICMFTDNLSFLSGNLSATNAAISSIRTTNCIDPQTIEDASLPTKSSIFRFPHPETALTFVTSDWYYSHYLIDRTTVIPIIDNCSANPL